MYSRPRYNTHFGGGTPLKDQKKRLYEPDGLCTKNNMLYFFMIAGGASEGNLSNFCNILLQNAIKRCSRENGFAMTLNIAGSENFECKARRKILPKARSSVKKCHFEQKSHLLAGPRHGRKEHLFGGAPSIQAQNHFRQS